MKKKLFNIIFFGAAILAVFLVWRTSNLQKKAVTNQPAGETISIVVVAEEKNINLSLAAGGTLYDYLLEAKNNGVLKLSGKQYPGLGFFVTDIGELHESRSQHLFYYINNIEASVGVSSYVPKDGDTILWKLK